MRFLAASLIAFLSLGSAGCLVETHSHRQPPPDTVTPANPTPDADPPRMPIDTDRTLHVEPGGGAGVFVTYGAGGEWNIFWTCDTKVSPRHACDVEIAVGTHGIKSLSATPQSALVAKDGQTFNIRTTTTTTIDSVTFQTEPGGPIALTMRIDGRVHPDLLWFVSNGVLTQAPSDPIELVPTAP